MGDTKALVGYLHTTNVSVANKTVIYFGGSGEIAYNAVIDKRNIFHGYTFACIDYPGSQESSGTMNLKSMQKAALNLYDYIVDLNCVDKANIFVIGYSYGTGIATYLASKRICKKLVLIAPYRDVIDLYNKIIPIFHSPFGWFITDNMKTKEYAKSVEAKTLIITSDKDKTLKSSISYSLAHYFKDANVVEMNGIKHEEYWLKKQVALTIHKFLSS